MTLECTKCRLAWIPRHAGEATCPRCASQVDVTRLAAELAESVRALAVSQGEAERLQGELAETLRLLDVKRQGDKPRYCKNCPFAEFLHPTPYGCVFEADDSKGPGMPS